MSLTRLSVPQEIEEIVYGNERSQKISGKIILENLLRDVLHRLFELILVVADFAHDPAVFDRVVQHDHYLNRLAIDGWHLQHIVKNVCNRDASRAIVRKFSLPFYQT